MPLLADLIGLGQPCRDFVIHLISALEAKGVEMIPRRKRFDAAKTRMLATARQDDVAVDPFSPNNKRSEAHPHLEGDARLLRQNSDRAIRFGEAAQFVEGRADVRRFSFEMRGERVTTARMRLIAISELPFAIRTSPHRSARCANPHGLELLAAIKARVMPKPAPIIDIRGESEKREVLPVHVVLQIEHSRKTRAGDLRLVPRAITALRRQ
jgi:hypothetical protein